jgi:hypothetical protein
MIHPLLLLPPSEVLSVTRPDSTCGWVLPICSSSAIAIMVAATDRSQMGHLLWLWQPRGKGPSLRSRHIQLECARRSKSNLFEQRSRHPADAPPQSRAVRVPIIAAKPIEWFTDKLAAEPTRSKSLMEDFDDRRQQVRRVPCRSLTCRFLGPVNSQQRLSTGTLYRPFYKFRRSGVVGSSSQMPGHVGTTNLDRSKELKVEQTY